MKELGNKIRELRISLGLSQQQFAESLGYTHKSMINKIELGKCDMSYDKILRLLKEYNLNASEFLNEEEIKKNCKNIYELLLPEANRIFPLKFCIPWLTAVIDSRSRWSVGWSIISILEPNIIILENIHLTFSPPDRTFTGLKTASFEKSISPRKPLK